jgi:NADPH:quinone reductase-like Zn-dependent oxidoreductase
VAPASARLLGAALHGSYGHRRDAGPLSSHRTPIKIVGFVLIFTGSLLLGQFLVFGAWSMFETADLSEGRLLGDVAKLVDDGAIRSTLTTAIPGLDPAGLRRAHELVAGGQTVGKVVVHR